MGTVGCLTYYLVAGKWPYTGDNKNQLYEAIRKDPVDFNVEGVVMSSQLKEFITKLLEKDPNERLGHNGADKVLEEAWIRDWKDKKFKTLQPPYIPVLDEG